MMPFESQKLRDAIIHDLAERNYTVQPGALPAALIQALRETLRERSAEFRPAKIGRAADASIAADIRNDSICWIDERDLRAPEAELFGFFDDLRLALNQELFLGLTDFEAHYARYDEGHFYKRHLDQFQADGARRISVVLYLNEDWNGEDGGLLRLYTAQPVDVVPSAGTLVAFTSSEIEHEVLPARRECISIAAWFRRS